MAYLVYQVGCIECGVSSYPISIHDDIASARKAASEHPSTWETEGGDGFVTIIDLDACTEVPLEPTEAEEGIDLFGEGLET
jgi:hypothetical protein